VPVDVGGDQVDVDQQQLLELRILLPAQVIASQDAGQIGVEITNAVSEQPLVAEHGRDLTRQRLDVDLGAPQLGQDAVEALHDLAQQLARHLTSPVGRPQDLDRVAVHPPTQLGHLVPRPGPDVLRDRTDPRIPNRPDEIAPLDQLPAARLSRVTLDQLPTLSKLAGDLGSRQISQQRRRKQLHDRQVVAGLLGSQVPEQAAPAPVIDGPVALGRLHAGQARRPQ
jgi:hypothetical protein